jgi:hypothetical protein
MEGGRPKMWKEFSKHFETSDTGLNAAYHKYFVPKATLKRHLDVKNYFAVENTQVIGSIEIFPHMWKRN